MIVSVLPDTAALCVATPLSSAKTTLSALPAAPAKVELLSTVSEPVMLPASAKPLVDTSLLACASSTTSANVNVPVAAAPGVVMSVKVSVPVDELPRVTPTPLAVLVIAACVAALAIVTPTAELTAAAEVGLVDLQVRHRAEARAGGREERRLPSSKLAALERS